VGLVMTAYALLLYTSLAARFITSTGSCKRRKASSSEHLRCRHRHLPACHQADTAVWPHARCFDLAAPASRTGAATGI